jgi:CBS domain-containing protein
MSDREPQFDVEQWIKEPADLVGDPTILDPWQELGDGDLAAGTFPGAPALEEARERTGLARTRITFIDQDTCISEESFYRSDDDDEGAAAAGRDGNSLLRGRRLPSLAERTPLWQVMSPRVVCVRADLGTDSLISILVALDLRAAPVVDDDGKPIGVVSRSDLLRHRREGEDGEPALRLVGPYGGHGDYLGPGFHTDVESERVADVMMCLAFSLPQTASLSRAAAVMAYEGVHQIPVVADDGGVVGLISSLDVVRWLAQHDGYLVPGHG